MLQSPIGRMASPSMRSIETFPSKQMYLYLSLIERKVTENTIMEKTKSVRHSESTIAEAKMCRDTKFKTSNEISTGTRVMEERLKILDK